MYPKFKIFFSFVFFPPSRQMFILALFFFPTVLPCILPYPLLSNGFYILVLFTANNANKHWVSFRSGTKLLKMLWCCRPTLHIMW